MIDHFLHLYLILGKRVWLLKKNSTINGVREKFVKRALSRFLWPMEDGFHRTVDCEIIYLEIPKQCLFPSKQHDSDGRTLAETNAKS